MTGVGGGGRKVESFGVTLGDKGNKMALEDIAREGDRREDVEVVADAGKEDGVTCGVGRGADLSKEAEMVVDDSDELFDKSGSASECDVVDSGRCRKKILDLIAFCGVRGEGFGEGGDVGGHGPIVEGSNAHLGGR